MIASSDLDKKLVWRGIIGIFYDKVGEQVNSPEDVTVNRNLSKKSVGA
jgi:hypothetical protein